MDLYALREVRIVTIQYVQKDFIAQVILQLFNVQLDIIALIDSKNQLSVSLVNINQTYNKQLA